MSIETPSHGDHYHFSVTDDGLFTYIKKNKSSSVSKLVDNISDVNKKIQKIQKKNLKIAVSDENLDIILGNISSKIKDKIKAKYPNRVTRFFVTWYQNRWGTLAKIAKMKKLLLSAERVPVVKEQLTEPIEHLVVIQDIPTKKAIAEKQNPKEITVTQKPNKKKKAKQSSSIHSESPKIVIIQPNEKIRINSKKKPSLSTIKIKSEADLLQEGKESAIAIILALRTAIGTLEHSRYEPIAASQKNLIKSWEQELSTIEQNVNVVILSDLEKLSTAISIIRKKISQEALIQVEKHQLGLASAQLEMRATQILEKSVTQGEKIAELQSIETENVSPQLKKEIASIEKNRIEKYNELLNILKNRPITADASIKKIETLTTLLPTLTKSLEEITQQIDEIGIKIQQAQFTVQEQYNQAIAQFSHLKQTIFKDPKLLQLQNQCNEIDRLVTTMNALTQNSAKFEAELHGLRLRITSLATSLAEEQKAWIQLCDDTMKRAMRDYTKLQQSIIGSTINLEECTQLAEQMKGLSNTLIAHPEEIPTWRGKIEVFQNKITEKQKEFQSARSALLTEMGKEIRALQAIHGEEGRTYWTGTFTLTALAELSIKEIQKNRQKYFTDVSSSLFAVMDPAVGRLREIVQAAQNIKQQTTIANNQDVNQKIASFIQSVENEIQNVTQVKLEIERLIQGLPKTAPQLTPLLVSTDKNLANLEKNITNSSSNLYRMQESLRSQTNLQGIQKPLLEQLTELRSQIQQEKPTLDIEPSQLDTFLSEIYTQLENRAAQAATSIKKLPEDPQIAKIRLESAAKEIQSLRSTFMTCQHRAKELPQLVEDLNTLGFSTDLIIEDISRKMAQSHNLDRELHQLQLTLTTLVQENKNYDDQLQSITNNIATLQKMDNTAAKIQIEFLNDYQNELTKRFNNLKQKQTTIKNYIKINTEKFAQLKQDMEILSNTFDYFDRIAKQLDQALKQPLSQTQKESILKLQQKLNNFPHTQTALLQTKKPLDELSSDVESVENELDHILESAKQESQLRSHQGSKKVSRPLPDVILKQGNVNAKKLAVEVENAKKAITDKMNHLRTLSHTIASLPNSPKREIQTILNSLETEKNNLALFKLKGNIATETRKNQLFTIKASLDEIALASLIHQINLTDKNFNQLQELLKYRESIHSDITIYNRFIQAHKNPLHQFENDQFASLRSNISEEVNKFFIRHSMGEFLFDSSKQLFRFGYERELPFLETGAENHEQLSGIYQKAKQEFRIQLLRDIKKGIESLKDLSKHLNKESAHTPSSKKQIQDQSASLQKEERALQSFLKDPFFLQLYGEGKVPVPHTDMTYPSYIDSLFSKNT